MKDGVEVLLLLSSECPASWRLRSFRPTFFNFSFSPSWFSLPGELPWFRICVSSFPQDHRLQWATSSSYHEFSSNPREAASGLKCTLMIRWHWDSRSYFYRAKPPLCRSSTRRIRRRRQTKRPPKRRVDRFRRHDRDDGSRICKIGYFPQTRQYFSYVIGKSPFCGTGPFHLGSLDGLRLYSK